MISTKESDIQSTPLDVFYKLMLEFGPFDLDAAANAANTKCKRWYGPGGEAEDALEVDWPIDVSIWCNPPYSRGFQARFVERAVDCSERGGHVTMLLPADTSTALYHDHVKQYPHWFLRGRIKFNGAKAGAKFGSVVVVFKK